MSNYSALSIAAYVIQYIEQEGRKITNLQLQKFLYFIQKKFLQTNGKVCFDDPIEAWQYGPVVRSVYAEYKRYGSQNISSKNIIYLNDKDKDPLEGDDKELIRQTIKPLQEKNAWELVQETHNSSAWQETDPYDEISIKKIRDER